MTLAYLQSFTRSRKPCFVIGDVRRRLPVAVRLAILKAI